AKAVRERVFRWFRVPHLTHRDQSAVPPVYGDMFSPRSSDPKPEWDLWVTPTQYARLEQWARGNFIIDAADKMPVAKSIDKMPLADQPHALDRAPLENILGGPFRPGIELTWTMRLKTMWQRPFRLNIEAEQTMPKLSWGQVLTPEVALGAHGPFSTS